MTDTSIRQNMEVSNALFDDLMDIREAFKVKEFNPSCIDGFLEKVHNVDNHATIKARISTFKDLIALVERANIDVTNLRSAVESVFRADDEQNYKQEMGILRELLINREILSDLNLNISAIDENISKVFAVSTPIFRYYSVVDI